MGELLTQIMSGGPGQLELNQKQQDFAQYCCTNEDHIKLLLKNVKPIMAGKLLQGAFGTHWVNTSEYEDLVLIIAKPLDDDAVRVLLTWLGHGPSFVNIHWERTFSGIMKNWAASSPHAAFLAKYVLPKKVTRILPYIGQASLIEVSNHRQDTFILSQLRSGKMAYEVIETGLLGWVPFNAIISVDDLELGGHYLAEV